MKEKTKKIVIIKIGSSVIVSPKKGIAALRIKQFAVQARELITAGYGVVFVVSGAVVSGEKTLKILADSSIEKQLLAGAGQVQLISKITRIFHQKRIATIQMLINKSDFRSLQKKNNIKCVVNEAAKREIVPIINENDVVELNSFGGNDYLASALARLVRCKYLIVLTDVDGVLSKEMTLLKEVRQQALSDVALIKNSGHKGGVGGMRAKIAASAEAANAGVRTVITNGKEHDIIRRLVITRERIGTKVIP